MLSIYDSGWQHSTRFRRLEPYNGKLSRTVLIGARNRKVPNLPDLGKKIMPGVLPGFLMKLFA